MIAHDFEYCRPETIAEALHTWEKLDRSGKNPAYYGGGTEIITLGRENLLSPMPGAVIDLKGIPECTVEESRNGTIAIGAARTLMQVYESGIFPALGAAGYRIADHTVQVKITLGGNIASHIKYREAVLPLLVSDSEMFIAGPEGTRQVPVTEVFDRQLQLKPSEFMVRVITPKDRAGAPYVHTKKLRNDRIGYPLTTVVAQKVGGQVKAAISGVCEFPFRSKAVEEALNDKGLSREERVQKAVENLPAPPITDLEATGEYREFVCRTALQDALEGLGVG